MSRKQCLGVVLSVVGAFWVGYSVRGVSPKNDARPLPPHLKPTEFRLSGPTGGNNYRVRDGGEPHPWVVYVTTPDGFTRAYTCDPVE